MSKVKWKKGTYFIRNKEKYIGKTNPTYRSTWEYKFCVLCDEHPNIVFWASEAISIKYIHPFTKKMKNYVPDFFVVYMDSKGRKRSELIEIKPIKEAVPRLAKNVKEKEAVVINMAKWEAARIYCRKNKIHFRIITEVDLFDKTKYSGNVKSRKRKRR